MEVWELKLYFYPSAGGFNKKKKPLLGYRSWLQERCQVLHSLRANTRKCLAGILPSDQFHDNHPDSTYRKPQQSASPITTTGLTFSSPLT